MKNNLLLGIWRHLVPVPRALWQNEVARTTARTTRHLAFMSERHQRVRNFVVRELPRVGKALTPEFIAQAIDLPVAEVIVLLDELEKRLTFLFRNRDGAVTWAYPVTVDATPHRVSFDTGEQIYAAWAIDAIATPFVQGHLRGEYVAATIQTECAHCHRPMRVRVDSEMKFQVEDQDAAPLVFVPMVDFARLNEPSIIDAFWKNSIFFWSEEHAQEYRKTVNGIRGTYFTLAQAMFMIPPTQGALFGFARK